MTAKGKINASNVQAGDRIIVQSMTTPGEIMISRTKTGEGVHVARVLSKSSHLERSGYGRKAIRIHRIITSSGEFNAYGIETMWLAPEDAPGVKRAHVEALAENAERQEQASEWSDPVSQQIIEDDHALALAEDEARTLAITPAELVGQMNQAHEATTGQCPNEWHRSAPARGRMICEECAPVVTVTGAIVNRGALETYNEAYRITGDRESALADLADQAGRENWQRLQVELAGKSWSTHFTKFDGTVLPRELTLHSQGGKVNHISEEDRTEEPEMTAATTTEVQNHTGSTVVSLLEKVWTRIRENHPELPEVVIITGSGLLGGSKWGHFRPDGWKVQTDEPARKHELFLAGEALAKGARQVLQTMLHEGAHTLSKVRGIQDTSRQHRWHNKEFKKAAEEMGLEHKASSADSSHGYSFVTLTTATAERYADLLEELDREIKLTCHLPIWLGGTAEEDDKGGEKIGKAPKGEGGDEKDPKKSTKAVCNCEEPNIIRVSDAVLDKRVIQCDDCDSLFHRESK